MWGGWKMDGWMVKEHPKNKLKVGELSAVSEHGTRSIITTDRYSSSRA